MELDRFDKHILEILSNEDVNLNALIDFVDIKCGPAHKSTNSP